MYTKRWSWIYQIDYPSSSFLVALIRSYQWSYVVSSTEYILFYVLFFTQLLADCTRQFAENFHLCTQSFPCRIRDLQTWYPRPKAEIFRRGAKLILKNSLRKLSLWKLHSLENARGLGVTPAVHSYNYTLIYQLMYP